MGDLAKAVAKLEEEVESVRELRKIAERLDTEIAVHERDRGHRH